MHHRHCQVRAQTPDSRPETTLCRSLPGSPSTGLGWPNLHVKKHHRWGELGLRLRPRNPTAVFAVEVPTVSKAEQGMSGNGLNPCWWCLWHSQGCALWIPSQDQTVNTEFYCDIQRRLREKNDLSCGAIAIGFSITTKHLLTVCWPQQHNCNSPPALLAEFGSLWLLLLLQNVVQTEGLEWRTSSANHRWRVMRLQNRTLQATLWRGRRPNLNLVCFIAS